jgi:hypothetical protein
MLVGSCIPRGKKRNLSALSLSERCGVGYAQPLSQDPIEVKPVSKAKAKAEPEAAPADPSFPEWLKHRLRFGLVDDCVILFIPSHARDKTKLRDQDRWASDALELMGKLFGGATGFTGLCGIWRDDENGGNLLDDQPIMIQSLAKREDVANPEKIEELASFLKNMGKTTKQGAVAIVINNAIHFISDYD